MDPKVKVRSFESDGILIGGTPCIYASSARTDVITGTGPSEARFNKGDDLSTYTGPRVVANQMLPRASIRAFGNLPELNLVSSAPFGSGYGRAKTKLVDSPRGWSTGIEEMTSGLEIHSVPSLSATSPQMKLLSNPSEVEK
jgi:hypothetical protein